MILTCCDLLFDLLLMFIMQIQTTQKSKLEKKVT